MSRLPLSSSQAAGAAPRTHSARPVLLACLLLLVCVALLAACREQDPAQTRKQSNPAPGLAEGQTFPPIKLVGASDTTLGIETLRGRMVVLNVWATWCPPCRREMPDLERLSRTLDPQRFAVIGLSTDRDRWLAEEFLGRNRITFPNFFDTDGSIARGLNLSAYPETFLIAPDGTLVMRVLGLREWDSAEIVAELEEAYRQWQAGSGHGPQ